LVAHRVGRSLSRHNLAVHMGSRCRQPILEGAHIGLGRILRVGARLSASLLCRRTRLTALLRRVVLVSLIHMGIQCCDS
jgi:hypothetical protein